MARKISAASEARAARMKDAEALILEAVPQRQVERLLADRFKVTEDVIRMDLAELERRWRRDGTSAEKLILLNLARRAASSGKVGQALAALRAAREGEATEESKATARVFKQIGKPDTRSHFAAIAWAHGGFALMLHKVLTDPKIKDHEREARALRIGRVMAGLTPATEIHEALEELRKAQKDEIEDDDAEVTPVRKSGRPMRSE